MTRDELKEKVARAIYKHQREFNEKPSDDFDCQPAWLRGAMMGAAEAALSAIEDAGMKQTELAVVPVEADDERLADLPEHPVEAMHRAWRTTNGVCGQTMDAVWRNKYAREMVAYRAMVEAGRVR